MCGKYCGGYTCMGKCEDADEKERDADEKERDPDIITLDADENTEHPDKPF